MTLAEKVMHHAVKNYNKGGWDIVVECYETKEIESMIAGAETLEEAINKVAASVNVQREYENDIRGYAGMEAL